MQTLESPAAYDAPPFAVSTLAQGRADRCLRLLRRSRALRNIAMNLALAATDCEPRGHRLPAAMRALECSIECAEWAASHTPGYYVESDYRTKMGLLRELALMPIGARVETHIDVPENPHMFARWLKPLGLTYKPMRHLQTWLLVGVVVK